MQEVWHFPKAYTKLPTYYINITTYSYYESLFCDNIIFFLCITLEDPCISITVTSSTIVILLRRGVLDTTLCDNDCQ